MLYTSFLLNGIIEYFLIKKYNIKVNNFLFNTYLISIISIILYLYPIDIVAAFTTLPTV